MFWEYLENTLQLIITIGMLLVSLFQYINSKKPGWACLVLFFLGTLVSSYHWTAYLLVMGETPNVSSLMTYIGWNAAFAVLFLLLHRLKSPEERRFFHPLMLLPVPLHIYQLTLYLPFGGEGNSIYQVFVLTAVACSALQSILYHRRRKQRDRRIILPAVAALVYVCCEFGMWTSTSLDWPVVNGLYYPCSILASVDCLFLVWAVRCFYGSGQQGGAQAFRSEGILKSVYFTMVVLLCAVGGILVGNWMRETIGAGLQEGAEVSAYDVIPVVLFVFSLMIVIFAVATVIVIHFGSRESSGGKTESFPEGVSAARPVISEDNNPENAGRAFVFNRTDDKGKRSRNNLIVPLLFILLLMIGMIVYTSQIISRVTVSNLHEVGEDRISGISSELETYLDKNKSVVRVAADTVDYMLHTGRTSGEILDYIQEETRVLAEQFNANYTGLYGYIHGEYLDGLSWVPPEGYDPTKRIWYTSAVDAGGEIIIVSPYLDAQTGEIVISICRQLTDGKDVLSLDMTMNNVQDMTRELKIREKGFGFIMNRDGMIIAHPDDGMKGQYLTDTEEQKAFLSRVLDTRNGYFEADSEGKSTTYFVRSIMDQWYVIIAISNEELFADHWKQLTVNVLLCSMIFILIAIFYYLGNKNEQLISRQMEEMKIEEQKQIYETRVLKLEKEAADQSNKAKSDFLAEMSHEIRTPINAVLGMNEMILRECARASENGPGPDCEKAFRNISSCAANIENAGNNLLAIINDILDFSKVEARRMDISESNYELSSLISDISNMISFRAREKGLEFRIDMDPAIPDTLCGDKVRVRQVIVNLLNNAVKYTDRGSVMMQVRCAEKEFRAGNTVTLLITVSDTGIGIREEDIPKLFVKFQRVDLDRNSTVEGTGLGLAISHGLLTLMNGKISVKSEYGKGTVFTVTLPQKVVSSEPVGNLQPAGTESGAGLKHYRESFRAPDAGILIVDDTRMNLEVAAGLLKQTGIRTDTAQSGQEALAKMKDNAYDVIILDQRMPGMDGTDILHCLRGMADSPNKKTPVICMTADAVIGARERYIEEGFTDYLPKPVSGESMEKVLIRYLPKEKVTLVSQAETAQALPGSADEEERWQFLRDSGVIPETGLVYCRQEKGLYESLLAEYARSAPEKSRSMEQYYSAADWKQYRILVHSLKSSSRMIGAENLSVAAEALEKAAKEENGDYIMEHHDEMIKQYRITAEASARAAMVKKTDRPEEEILEFPPEE